MAGYLTTHVLDTALGRPAAGMRIDLARVEGGTREALATLVTGADGRTDRPILPADAFREGRYELVFHVGDYLDRLGPAQGAPRFLDLVPVRFAMAEAEHHHVPLLVSPYGYSTYRGS